MTIEAMVIPPRYPNLQILPVGDSEKEKEILRKTALLFDTKPDYKAHHYLIADGEELLGFLNTLFAKIQEMELQLLRVCG